MSLQDPIEEGRTEDEMAAARAELERKSAEELFASTLDGEYADDAAWEAVSVLRLRGTPEVFSAAKRYCELENPKARTRGLSVLAQLGAGKPKTDRPFIGESVSIAIAHLGDSDPEAMRSAAWALSHLGTQPAVAALIALRRYHDPDVRQAVACCIELRRHPDGVGILLALMEDEDEIVRDWATFAVGSEDFVEDSAFDSAEIRAALRARLEDTHEEARREAIWGLARRRDPIGLKLLVEKLETENWWSGDEDTAEEILGYERETPVKELCQGLRRLLA
jgi:HEAT repeat protein